MLFRTGMESAQSNPRGLEKTAIKDRSFDAS